MFTFTNTTTKEQYNNYFRGAVTVEDVPNTAKGLEKTRKNITMNGHTYFLSANTEKDYFLQCDEGARGVFSVFFRAEGDRVTINSAAMNGRRENAERYLAKYARIVSAMHTLIKYGKAVEYIAYR